MKSKKRHHSISSEETGESDASAKSSSSSNSDSEVSSLLEHRHKKKRKRADSSESDSESDNQKRAKKRKHKKKKKKHGKKKRRSGSADESASDAEDVSSVSEGEISSKKKRKHKHKHKRTRSSSASEIEDAHVQRRIHSVVKERRGSSEEESHPVRTYYQKEYRRSMSADYEREREVQRFYRGSSKERRAQAPEQYGRERSDRYQPYQNKYDTNRDKFTQNVPYTEYNDDYGRRQRDYNEYKRNPRYEDHRPPEDEFNRRPREEAYARQDQRGFNQNNRFEDRAPKRRDYEPNKDYRERRGPPEIGRFNEREFPEKKERFREEYGGPSDRARDTRREKPAGRLEKSPVPHREYSRSRSVERYRERTIKTEPKDDRDTRYRDSRGDGRDARGEGRGEARGEIRGDVRGDGRGDGRGDVRGDGRGDGRGDVRGDGRGDGRSDVRGDGRSDGRDNRRDRNRSEERKVDRRDIKIERRSRERKTRFTDNNESKEYSWGKADVKKESDKNKGEKEKPNFGLSGKLTADANTVNGVVIKYTEPDDAKQPKRRWRFYPFKGDKALPILYIHRQSAFLIGRDKKVCDIPLEHPSISKQHSALQYRATPFTRPDGSQGRRVRPYIIDLESANGTFVNNKKIEPRRYVELLERDVVKFGFSQREYVLLHENSKDDAQDDDEPPAAAPRVATTDQIKHEKRIKQELVEDGE
ncbi:probable serine/threonine-protein kinase DDB_G0280133 [Manduca sexta]|uniref:probable serine/threonine-protein kinase DDB_G0280133 n=1 Tax=Manduca sexta TaxID=7130 RepID=UPI00188F3491|nr:probable serine/threonine-protein kinase DDB_G0280133 [Manduca sexta]